MIDILKIYFKSLKYIIGRQTETWKSQFLMIVQLIVDLYQHLWWSNFYLLLLVLQLLQKNIFRNTFRWLLPKRKNDIVSNYNIKDNKKGLHDSKYSQKKTYNAISINRSSPLLLDLLFWWFAKVSLIREAMFVLLKKRTAGCFRN